MPKKRSGSLKKAWPSSRKDILLMADCRMLVGHAFNVDKKHLISRCRNLVLAVTCFVTYIPAHAQFSRIERHILEDFTEDRTSGNTHIFKEISNSANYVSLGLPVSLFLAGAITHDRDMRQKGLFVAESVVVSSIVTFGLKYSISRPRPFEKDPLIIAADKGGSPSFPSGHTSEAFASATAVSLAYPKWYVIVPSFAWASAVGYSRMYLGVHYPSDVVAGALVGSASAWFTWKANKWLQGRKRRALLPAN